MVTTRTLSNYLASLPPAPGPDATLVTQDLQAYSSANILTAEDVGTAAFASATDFATAAQGAEADSAVKTIVEGTNVTVDSSDPQNPIISVTGGAGVIGPMSSVVGNLASWDNASGSLLADSGFNPATLGDLAFEDEIAVSQIAATGTPGNTTFLRGDGSWQVVAGGGGVQSVIEGTGIDVDSTDPDNPIVSIQAGYLGTAAFQPATAFQAADADLTSWAAITRAAGFDAFATTPSSANLRALLTDEVGTGSAYFVGGALGTPASVNLTNGTALPIIAGTTGTLTVARGGTGETTAAAAFTALKQVATTSATGVVQLATTAEVRAKTAADRSMTPGNAWAAAAWVNLGSITGAVTLDFSTFLQAYGAMTGNITLGQPTALPDGVYTLHVTHSGAARTISLNSTYWDTPGGAGLTLSTTAGQSDLLTIIKKPGGKALISVVALNVGA